MKKELNLITVIAILLGSNLTPVVYYLLFGFPDIQTKIMITPSYEFNFVVPGLVNVFTIIFLIDSLMAGYVILKEYNVSVKNFLPYLLITILPIALIKIEFYNVCLIIITLGFPYGFLYFIDRILKKTYCETEKSVGMLLGIFFGISIGSAIGFNLFVGFIIAVLMFVYFLIIYKVQDIVLSSIKSLSRNGW